MDLMRYATFDIAQVMGHCLWRAGLNRQRWRWFCSSYRQRALPLNRLPGRGECGANECHPISERHVLSLRHTHATLLMKHSVHPKVASERLGHADITLTLQTYSHVLPQMQQQAADLFASAVAQGVS